MAAPSVLTLDDFESDTRAVIDVDTDTITFKEIEEELKGVEVVKKVLTREQRKKKEEEERQFAALKESVAFETTTFHIIMDVDKENKTAKFIVETILFQDPAGAAARLAYLEYAELTGGKLETFFRHESIGGKVKNLIDHIDEKIRVVDHYHKTRRICDQIAQLDISQVLSVCMEAVKDICPGKEYAKLYDKMVIMMGATIERHKPWIEAAKDYVLDHPNKDQVVTQTFAYVKKMLDSTHELAQKGVVSTQKEVPQPAEAVPVEKLFSGTPTKNEEKELPKEVPKEEPVPTNIDPTGAYVKPVLFALFILPSQDINLLYRRFKKIAK